MKSTQLLAVSALGMLLATGCTKAETPEAAADKPVAVVNGTPISRDVWNLYVKTRHAGKTPGDLTVDEQNAALEELIGMYAGAQEADKQNLGAGEPNARLELVGNSAKAEMLYKKFSEGAQPTDEELKSEYDTRIAEALGSDFKGKASVVAYVVAIAIARIQPWVSFGIYTLVALWWLVPDRRFERILSEHA